MGKVLGQVQRCIYGGEAMYFSGAIVSFANFLFFLPLSEQTGLESRRVFPS
jgi:hypothetical protein